MNGVESEVNILNKEYYLIIVEGTNDVGNVNYYPKVLINNIEIALKLYIHTNIIISSIPYRCDDPKMNHHIRKFNNTLRIITHNFSHDKICFISQCLTFRLFEK